MKQAQLVEALDEFFQPHRFNEGESWRALMTSDEHDTLARFVRSGFWGAANGLMLDNARTVERVYLVVFPSREVLDTIIAREVADGAPGALIFAHHLCDYQESASGFVQIPEAQLEELREHQISFYHCHAPLDVHPEISTGVALANALGLRDQERFGDVDTGRVGVVGSVGPEPLGFQAFAARLAKVTDVPHLRYDQVRFNARLVRQVAVVPGGGAEGVLMREAEALGCDTFVTGQWWLFHKSAYADKHRQRTREQIPQLAMNLLASSHYATEMVVMRDQMPAWFRSHGVPSEFIPQEDPWR